MLYFSVLDFFSVLILVFAAAWLPFFVSLFLLWKMVGYTRYLDNIWYRDLQYFIISRNSNRSVMSISFTFITVDPFFIHTSENCKKFLFYKFHKDKPTKINYGTPFWPKVQICFHDERLRFYYERSRFSRWTVEIFMMRGRNFHDDRSRFSWWRVQIFIVAGLELLTVLQVLWATARPISHTL